MSTQRTVRASIIAVAVLGLVLVGTVTKVLAETATLDGLMATSRVTATPLEFWYGQVNRDGICRLVTGCVGSSGVDPAWVFRVRADSPTGVQTVDVNVAMIDQTSYSGARYRLAFASTLGNLTGDVVLVLQPQGTGTDVSLRLEAMTATGFATGVLDQFRTTLQPYLTSQLAVLSRERVDAGTAVSLAVRPGRTAVATVTVAGATLTARSPKAVGQLRLLVNGKLVCTSAVTASRGTCRFAAPPRGASLQAVVTGTFDNGYSVWNSVTGRYGR